MGKKKKGKGYGSIVLTVVLISIIAFAGVGFAEQEWLPGYGDKNGRLGKKNQSWRIVWVNTVAMEGATTNAFEVYLRPVDPTADNTLLLPDISGILITNSGGEEMFNVALISPIINTPTINHGTDAQAYIANVSGVMVPVSLSFTGDLNGAMANSGIWNGQIVANAVGNTEIDNTGNYTVNNISISSLTTGSVSFVNSAGMLVEDNPNFTWDNTNNELIVSNRANEAEMFISEVTIALDAGGAWANITSMTIGLVSANGMIQNGTDGSITVPSAGRYKSVLGASIEDNDGPSEEYHMSMAVNGVEVSKCEQHRSISNQASLGAITVPCMFDLSANDVVTALANSIGGDDLTFEHLHWLLFK